MNTATSPVVNMVSSPVAATSLAEVISHAAVTNHVPVSSMVRVVISHKVRAATSHVVKAVISHAEATSHAEVISHAAITSLVPANSMVREVISHKVKSMVSSRIAVTSHVVNMVSSLAEATSLVVVISHVAAISPAVTRVAPRAVLVLKRRSRSHTIPMQNIR
jgi:hypothetical protein